MGVLRSEAKRRRSDPKVWGTNDGMAAEHIAC